jgi:hypothetical protein
MNDDLVFKTDGEEKFRIPFSTPYVGTKCPEMKLEAWKERAQSSAKSVREHIDLGGCYD